MQKNGAGLHCASSCFWDNRSDGKRNIKFESYPILKSSEMLTFDFRMLYSEMGKQKQHVLHHNCFWISYLNRITIISLINLNV